MIPQLHISAHIFYKIKFRPCYVYADLSMETNTNVFLWGKLAFGFEQEGPLSPFRGRTNTCVEQHSVAMARSRPTGCFGKSVFCSNAFENALHSLSLNDLAVLHICTKRDCFIDDNTLQLCAYNSKRKTQGWKPTLADNHTELPFCLVWLNSYQRCGQWFRGLI